MMAVPKFDSIIDGCSDETIIRNLRLLAEGIEKKRYVYKSGEIVIVPVGEYGFAIHSNIEFGGK